MRRGRSVRHPVVTRAHAGSNPAASASSREPRSSAEEQMPLKHPVVGANPTAASIVGVQVGSSDRDVNFQHGWMPSSRCLFQLASDRSLQRGLLAQGREHAVADRGIQVRLLDGLPLLRRAGRGWRVTFQAVAVSPAGSTTGASCDVLKAPNSPPCQKSEVIHAPTPRCEAAQRGLRSRLIHSRSDFSHPSRVVLRLSSRKSDADCTVRIGKATLESVDT